jgi:hypothetical protein
VVPLFAITTFFGAKKPYKNGDVAQTQLVEYLVLLLKACDRDDLCCAL